MFVCYFSNTLIANYLLWKFVPQPHSQVLCVYLCVCVYVCDGGVVSLRYKDLEAIMLSSV